MLVEGSSFPGRICTLFLEWLERGWGQDFLLVMGASIRPQAGWRLKEALYPAPVIIGFPFSSAAPATALGGSN